MTNAPFKRPSAGKRWTRRLLWAALLLGTLVPLYYAVVNWRGAKAWQKAKAAYEAAGETLDWEGLLPSKKVPEAQNFFAIPLFQDLGLPHNDEADIRRQRLTASKIRLSAREPAEKEALGGFAFGRPLDYAVWRHIALENGLPMPEDEPNDARAILTGIEESIDWFHQVDQAATRPRAQILPLIRDHFDRSQPWTLALPYLSAVRSAALWLSYRAQAAIGCGDTETAKVSLTGILRLIQGMENEPMLINQIASYSMRAMLIHQLWMSLHRRLWDDAELQEWERELAQLQPYQRFRYSLRTETAFMMTSLEHFKELSLSEALGPQPSLFARMQLALMPKGRLDQEKAKGIERFTRMQKALEVANFSLAKPLMEALDHEYQNERSSLMQGLDNPDMVRRWMVSAAVATTLVRQARIAIALERHFLAHQRYPETLEALVPNAIDVLPEDPMGQPWQYRPTSQRDTYTLYSVGWNLSDDGGIPAERGHPDMGDYVWTR